MSRTIAPLLSFGASGQIAKTQVYSTWKGRPYARRYAIPSNPNTLDQQETRNTFRFLNNVWKYFPANAIDAWQAYADSSRFTDRNGFIKQNLASLRGDSDLAGLTFSPSASGGLAAAGISVTPGSGQLTVTLTAPALPVGWTISTAVAAAVRDQDPQTGVLYQVFSALDSTTPFAPVITGLTASVLWRVGGWFVFLKPNGDFAYGQSLQSSGTPS